MDISGAQALRQRLAQQEHWQQAASVRLGSQPSIDPDGYALESFTAWARYYRPELKTELVGDRQERVTRRLCKRLVDGAWEDDVVVEVASRVA